MHIKNGSLMDEEWIKNYALMYETIGFSVDSINDEEFELLLCDKFVILKLVIVICLRRIIVEKERKI